MDDDEPSVPHVLQLNRYNTTEYDSWVLLERIEGEAMMPEGEALSP
jgi:hypothetical protein